MGMDIGPAKGKKKGRSHPEMNVTPLVDVVLVLLIIFMVMTPMMNEHFWIHVPSRPTEPVEASAPDPDDQGPIVVSVNAQGQIRINRDVYPDADFPVRLRRMLAARAERRVYFDADDDAPFERAVAVLDMARGGGAAHIAVMTEALH
ncbi:MAG: biopolymer transporter ExbD [Deltaproteobacteria bacterium]|nr:biopolymer transporter ExbD [Deltaproteobacteria bacterium]